MIWTQEKEAFFRKCLGRGMENSVEFHTREGIGKEDMEFENSSDSGLEECSASPNSTISSVRLSTSPSSSFEIEHTKAHIPFRPQIITPSEGSAFSKIDKLITPTTSTHHSVFPPSPFGAPPGVGYLPGIYLPPWMANSAMQQAYTGIPTNTHPTSCKSEAEEVQDPEPNKNIFTEVDTSIPFTNYFQNLTKLFKRTTNEEVKNVQQHDDDESDSEPGEIIKGGHKEGNDRYSARYTTTGMARNSEQEEFKKVDPVPHHPGVFPNGLSMAHLLGPHPYLSVSLPQAPQISPNSQMLQYLGGTQPPTGLLHPALLHMAGIRARRINAEKPPPIKKYKCDVCGKAFSRSNTLVTHKRIHTGDKPFKCEVCSRAFRQPGNLTRHRLTHTTVKPYVCPTCNKAFNRASNLHTHMRTHTNFKPYTCPYCGKGFHQKIDMKIHCYTHTGERPHRCDICGKGFTLISTLNAHRRIHSENMTGAEMA